MKIKYKNSSLEEVVIQIRFPRILKINSVKPFEFQEMIRKSFPNYQLIIEQGTQSPTSFNPNIGFLFENEKINNYCFISADNKYKINLTEDFISLSTNSYSIWDDFVKLFIDIFTTFNSIYNLTFINRIGLRYIDVFSKNKLGLNDISWNDLIKDKWRAGFAIAPSEDNVINTSIDVEYSLDDDIHAKIHGGLALFGDSGEKVYVLDTDMIKIGQIEYDNVLDILNCLHKEESKIYKEFLTQLVSDHMEPEKYE